MVRLEVVVVNRVCDHAVTCNRFLSVETRYCLARILVNKEAEAVT